MTEQTTPVVRKTAGHLADGRELFYFDDTEPYLSGGATRVLHDARPLGDRFAPVPDDSGAVHPFVGPQMRRDPLTGDWIPMASHRMNRTFMPPAGSCPLCPAKPGSDYSDGEVPDTAYDIAVFENRFPSLLAAPHMDPAEQWDMDGESLWPVRHAAGRCEVVCFTSDHNGAFSKLSKRRVRSVIDVWADRTMELSKLPGIQQVFPFENRGEAIGVTLHHPHGQIYAYPYLPPKMEAYIRQAQAYKERTGHNLLHDVLEAEKRAGTRIVLESDHWTAYVPAAARWPVEVHVAPNRDVLDFAGLTVAERDDLAGFYLRLLKGLDTFFIDPKTGQPLPLPYIAGWHQAPVDPVIRDLGRLHLELISIQRSPDKIKYLAGSESSMGAWISDTTPERIAARIKEVLA